MIFSDLEGWPENNHWLKIKLPFFVKQVHLNASCLTIGYIVPPYNFTKAFKQKISFWEAVINIWPEASFKYILPSVSKNPANQPL